MAHNLDTLFAFVFWTSIFIALIADVKLFGLCNGGRDSWSRIHQNAWLYCIALGALTTYLVPLTTMQALTAGGIMVAGVCAAKEFL